MHTWFYLFSLCETASAMPLYVRVRTTPICMCEFRLKVGFRLSVGCGYDRAGGQGNGRSELVESMRYRFESMKEFWEIRELCTCIEGERGGLWETSMEERVYGKLKERKRKKNVHE